MPKGLKYLPLLIPVVVFLVFTQRIGAERLPIRLYTTADGLPRDQINKIVRDSRGFLWFCTPEGLSRFDGYTFVNFTTDQGLPSRNVNDLLETRSGHYWVATGNGLARFNPDGDPLQVADLRNPIPDSRTPQSATRNPQSQDPMFVVY